MKPHERQPQIEAIIRREGEVSVEMLAERFDVSSETIRRDLGSLAELGRVQKVHGGARRARLIHEPSHDQRETTARDAKAAIGRRLAEAVEPGETLFIDTGSTTLAAAAFPDSRSIGFDLIVRGCRTWVLEANGFGDLLPDLRHRGRTTYEDQAALVADRAVPAERVHG